MAAPAPLSASRFRVEFDGLLLTSVSRVVLPCEQLRTVLHGTGDDDPPRTITAGLVAPQHFVVSRGVTTDTELWDWWRDARDGAGTARSAAVVVLDASGSEQVRWNLSACDPVGYWVSPLDAKGTEVLTETLCMTTRSMDRH